MPPESVQYTYSTDGGSSWTDYKTLAPEVFGVFGERNTHVSPIVIDESLWALYSNRYKIRYKVLTDIVFAEAEDGSQFFVNASTIAVSIIAISLATVALLKKRNSRHSTVSPIN